MTRQQNIPIILLLFLFILNIFFAFPLFAEDTLTITTYYPSPYGVYRELRAKRIAIGDDYIDGASYTWQDTESGSGEVDYTADLVVEGNVGIGTVNPGAKLDVTGASGAANNILMHTDTGYNNIEFIRGGTSQSQIYVDSSGNMNLRPYSSGTWPYSLVVAQGGNVGIGTGSPGVSLDVAGGLRAGSKDAVTSCGLGQINGEGAQRYNYTTHNMEYCNGTSWVSPGGDTASLGTRGYTKLPSGLIIQWGTVSAITFSANNGGTFGTVTFPISFPSGVFSVVATLTAAYPGGSYIWYDHSVKVGSITQSSFVIWVAAPNNGGYSGTYGANWIATGY
ncbi:MAG: hypothetical protein PHY88_03215 [Candidatus Omnitrophica bacterium]|nr:hypothetical protein [Candidatus Omnitrophota bacterium]